MAHFGSVFYGAKKRPKNPFPNTPTSAVARPGWPLFALMWAPLLAPGYGKRNALKRSVQRKALVLSAGQKPAVLYGTARVLGTAPHKRSILTHHKDTHTHRIVIGDTRTAIQIRWPLRDPQRLRLYAPLLHLHHHIQYGNGSP